MMDLVTGFDESDLKGIDKTVVGGLFVQKSSTDIETRFLDNEVDMLEIMSGSGFTPEVVSTWDRMLTVTNLGESEPVTDEVLFRRNCAKLLGVMRDREVRHGDLTSKNIVVRDNVPMVVDWKQSRVASDPGPDKRIRGDAFHLWQAATELSPDTSRHLRKWAAIRPHTRHGSINDLGCAEADYLLFAWSENSDRALLGVENHHESFLAALKLVLGKNMSLSSNNLCRVWYDIIPTHTIFFMSVYPHLPEQFRDVILRKVIESSDQLFFEAQHVGDGPGTFNDDDEIYGHLLGKGANKVEALITLPVHGRDHERTVWMVT